MLFNLRKLGLDFLSLLFLLWASMFFLIPAEISAVLTFFSAPCFGCSVVFFGCSGCSWARTDAAGVKNNAITTVVISLENI